MPLSIDAVAGGAVLGVERLPLGQALGRRTRKGDAGRSVAASRQRRADDARKRPGAARRMERCHDLTIVHSVAQAGTSHGPRADAWGPGMQGRLPGAARAPWVDDPCGLAEHHAHLPV